MHLPHRHDSALDDELILQDLPSGKPWSGKIAFLDRDGVLNRWSENYINTPDELILLPDAAKSVGMLKRAGFRICVVTNQSPIGRGIWGHDVLNSIHHKLQELLAGEDPDAIIDLILYSPYSPEDESWARKPNPGMLEVGRQLLDSAHEPESHCIQLLLGPKWLDRPDEGSSFLVGDQQSDIFAANRYGVRGIRCDTEVGLGGVIKQILEIQE